MRRFARSRARTSSSYSFSEIKFHKFSTEVASVGWGYRDALQLFSLARRPWTMEDFCASQQGGPPGISILWKFMPWKVKSQVAEIGCLYKFYFRMEMFGDKEAVDARAP
jgi:hypothetical protein